MALICTFWGVTTRLRAWARKYSSFTRYFQSKVSRNLRCIQSQNIPEPGGSAAPQKACYKYHIPTRAGLLFMFARLLLARSAYKWPTKNNFTSLMKSRNIVALPDVMLTSHSIPQATWNVIIMHPFWGAAEQVVVLLPDSFLPRVAVRVGKGSAT